MPKSFKEDLTGNVYGKLTVLGWDEEKSKRGKNNYWFCKCECGVVKSIARSHLIREESASCGCTLRKPNKFEEFDENTMIGYTNNGESYLIDKEDFDKVKNTAWSFDDGYLKGYYEGKVRKLHNVLIGKKEGYVVDHIDGDTSNYKRNNLRFCTKQQNAMNRCVRYDNKTGVAGVYWHRRDLCWYVSISGKHIGKFYDFDEAVKVRKAKEEEVFGEYRRKESIT